MSYGERLDQALALAGKDRKALAAALGISVQAIGQSVRGPGMLKADNSAKAAKYLAVDHHWLATGEGEARPRSLLSPLALDIAKAFDALVRPEIRERMHAQVMGMIELSTHSRPETELPAPLPSGARARH